jgi:holliday junction DNA helicase RuvA
MISTIYGVVSEKLADSLIIELNDVGYGIYVCYEDYSELSEGDKVKLYIYEHIRENSHDLYGFSNKITKQLFEQLINVNGVGPKMGLSILGLGKSDEVRSQKAIQTTYKERMVSAKEWQKE